MLQTALQLIQDPKGWEILGDLISNPDFIAQFLGGAEAKGDRASMKNLFRSITRAGKSSKNNGKGSNCKSVSILLMMMKFYEIIQQKHKSSSIFKVSFLQKLARKMAISASISVRWLKINMVLNLDKIKNQLPKNYLK